MNQKEERRWELRLGLFQVVVLLGLIMGLMTCIFFLGYFSGRQVGHEAALSASLSNTIKLPIGSEDRVQADNSEEATDRVATEVYAKLGQNRGDSAKTQEDKVAVDMPRLGAIDSTVDAPIEAVPGNEVANLPVATVVAQEFPIENIAQDAQITVSPAREQLLKEVMKEGDSNAPAESAKDLQVTAEPSVIPTVVPTKIAVPTATYTPINTPKPKVTKAAAAASDEGSLPKGWFAQVAAPKKKEDASILASQLRKSGFQVIVEVAQVRGEQYFRILAGPENSKAQAEKLVQQLSREPYVPTKPFIRQIK
jgi:cell division septation protein DedD